MKSYYQLFCEHAERAGHRALIFVDTHAAQPRLIVEHRHTLFQALSSVGTHGRDPSLAVQLTLRLHEKMLRAGLWSEWEPYLTRALTVARHSHDRAAEYHLLCALGDVRAYRGDWQAALEPLRAAIQLEAHGEGEWVRSYGRCAESLLSLGQPEEAEAILQTALHNARKRADVRAEILVTGQLGRTCWRRGDWTQVTAYFQEALNRARDIGWAEQILSNVNFLGSVQLDIDQPATALPLFAEALDLCRQFNDRSGEGVVLGNLGRAYLQLGDLAAAQAVLEQALTIHRLLENNGKLAISLHLMGQLNIRRRDLPTAAGYLAEAVKVANTTLAPSIRGRIWRIIGEYEQVRGRRSAAALAYARSRELFLAAGETYLAGEVSRR